MRRPIFNTKINFRSNHGTFKKFQSLSTLTKMFDTRENNTAFRLCGM